MAIRPLNSVAGFSVGETPTSIILANGDITTTNITTTGVSNLNSIGNVKISGGTGGQVISTDGSGNLSFITVSTAGLSNGTSNIAILNNGNITFSVGGNANVGVLTSTGLNVAGYLTATGNVTGGNITTSGQLVSTVSTGTAPLSVSSTTLVSNLNADLLDGYNTATANTASTVVVRDTNGNVSANFFIGNGSQLTGLPSGTSIANGNSNVSAGTANGNITVSVAGNANVVTFTGTGVNVAGNLEATGVKTDNLYYANGNPWDLQQPAGANNQIQFNDNGSFGASANFTFDAANTTLAVGGDAAANINVGNSLVGTTILGDSITVGNLVGVEQAFIRNDVISLSGNASTGNAYVSLDVDSGVGYSSDDIYSTLNSTGLIIDSNTNNAVISLYANGAIAATNSNDTYFSAGGTALMWLTVDNAGFEANANVATHTSKFQAPQLVSNVATGTAPFVVTSTTQVANLNVATAGTAGTAGSATTAGTVTTNAQPNITSVGTLTSLSVTGTTTSGNLSTGGTLSVTGNANVGNLGTAGLVVATGNVTGGNLTTAGLVVATGNVTGGNLVTGGALSVTGNANIGNISAAAGVFTTVAGSLTTSAQPNITSVGTLTSLTVTGTATAGNLSTGGTLSVTGNANVGNLGTSGLITATGNVSGGNLTTGGVVAATGNVSGGNVTTGGAVVATGNVSGGNLTTGGIVNATGNIVSGANVVTDLIVGKTASVTITAVGSDQNINLVPTGNGTVNVGNFIIANVATPVASTDAATKQYVDDIAQGLHTHDSCNAATSTTLATSSGGTVTYNNGTSGVGATLTTTGSYTTIDGVTLSNGMRILVKNEANAAHNGIYDRTSSTVLTRSADFDTPTEMAGGDFTFVNAGTLYDNTGWVMPDPVTTVGTTDVVWVQFSGAGTYTAGTGLVLNGNQFSIGNTTVTAGSYGNGDYNATFTVNEQGQLSAAANVAITANAANLTGTTLASTIVNSSLTSVGTLTSLAVTGNATAGNVYANSGTIGASLLTGTLTTAAQPNVTSVGTLTSLTVTGTATAGNLSTGGTLSVTSNANVGNLGTGGLIVATGNVTGGNLTTGGVVTATGNVSGGNLTTGGVVAATGNVSGGNLTTGGAVVATGNVSGGNLTTAGALAVTGNASVGNLSATNGNLTTANVSGNIILGNASVTTAISWASATTTAITANQTIASFSVTGVTGVEFVVKGIDSTGSKYSVATVQAVTDGTNVDYSTFGTVNLGGFTGSLAVNVVGGFVRLQVTPASSNSTVWTTQYRFI